MQSDTERQLGILIGGVSAINARLDRADQSRTNLHQRLDALAGEVHDVKSKVEGVGEKVDTLSTDVAEMKPEVALVRGIKTKAGGAVVVIGSIGALLAWVINNFWDAIRAGIGRAFH